MNKTSTDNSKTTKPKGDSLVGGQDRKGEVPDTGRAKAPPKTLPNPAYEEYQRRQRRDARVMSGWPDEDSFPEDHGKALPDDGGWILLLMTVRAGRLLKESVVRHIEVKHLTVWFAIPTKTTSGGGLYQAVIQTPDGPLHVWPHEYRPIDIDWLLQYSDKEGLYTRFLGSAGGFDEQQMFYLRSRGISKAEAQRLLLKSAKDPHYCYFEFADAYRKCFPEGTGAPYLMPHNHKRRACAALAKARGER